MHSFSSLMDIDKLIRVARSDNEPFRFSSLMDIDKLILEGHLPRQPTVLVH